MNEAKTGSVVNIHYRGTFEDGTEFDNSHLRNEPMTVEVGSGQLISGFDSALLGMVVGETKTVNLTPDTAYGDVNDLAFQTFPKSAFPPDFDFKVGMAVEGRDPAGVEFRAVIDSQDGTTVVLNFNHSMAGKNLNFEIELVSINEG